MSQAITADELEQWKLNNPNHLIVDVREEYEFQEENIGGLNIPLEEVVERMNELPGDKTLLFCCKSGKRSAAIAYTLSNKYGKSDIYTLKGGIESIPASH